jgi:hypothetical protein
MEARHQRGQKTGAAAAFFGELIVPAVGGVLHQGGEKEWAQVQLNPKKG